MNCQILQDESKITIQFNYYKIHLLYPNKNRQQVETLMVSQVDLTIFIIIAVEIIKWLRGDSIIQMTLSIFHQTKLIIINTKAVMAII